MTCRALLSLGLLLMLAGARSASAQVPYPPGVTAPTPWTPPTGIPAPAFGITQEAPADPVAYCPGWPNAENATCWYIDNTHASATDTVNVLLGDIAGFRRGTPSRPRATIPTGITMIAGSYMEIRGGTPALPYTSTNRTIRVLGTAAQPVFIKGVGMPSVCGTPTTNRQFTFNGAMIDNALIGEGIPGTYVIIEGLLFDNCRPSLGSQDYFYVTEIAGGQYSPVRFAALRKSIIRNNRAGGSAINVQGEQIVLYANEIAHNRDTDCVEDGADAVPDPVRDAADADNWVYLGECDRHGLKPDVGDSQIWFVDNHVHHNGGDAIQIGDANSFIHPPPEPDPNKEWVHHVYVGRNDMHDNKENAVDIKRARDVIVSDNHMYNFYVQDFSGGEAAITHNNPERIWFVNNKIHNVVQGIVSTGASGYYVIGNVVYDVFHDSFQVTCVSTNNPIGCTYDPGSLFSSAAIHTRATMNTAHINNTVFNADSGFSLASHGGGTSDVSNNIFHITQSSHQIGLQNVAAKAATTVKNNLIIGAILLKLAGSPTTMTLDGCTACLNIAAAVAGDPKFVNANGNPRDLRIRSDSPAVGAGVADHAVYALFETTYQPMFPGLTIRRDISGASRPQAGTWDIGAFEFRGGPAAVTGLTRVP